LLRTCGGFCHKTLSATRLCSMASSRQPIQPGRSDQVYSVQPRLTGVTKRLRWPTGNTREFHDVILALDPDLPAAQIGARFNRALAWSSRYIGWLGWLCGRGLREILRWKNLTAPHRLRSWTEILHTSPARSSSVLRRREYRVLLSVSSESSACLK
jgi:hypothetical protein